MSILTQKLQEASQLFQNHHFKKSLEAYTDCINFCHTTKEDQSVIHNILSTKATLLYILGQFEDAHNTLNQVLSKDPSHFLCLLRRSQVYKKRNKLGKALRDLDKIFVFCPDNLQISAFRVQIQHMLLKQGSTLETSSQSEEQGDDEQLKLNFMNLKMIDRKSSDITATLKERKSRVTILGDTLFQYNEEQGTTGNKEDQEEISQKDIRTLKEIKIDDQLPEEAPPSIKINISQPKKPKKSILKNKGTSIFVVLEEEDQTKSKQKILGRESKLLSMLKSIDGKVIPSAKNQEFEPKEVLFRKSVSQTVPLEVISDPYQSPIPNSQSRVSNNSAMNSSRNRKSCLKRPSFQLPPQLKQKRSSRFEGMGTDKIDGKILHHRKRNSIEQKEGEEAAQDSDSDNDASSHNIFGNFNISMPEDLKKKLGMDEEIPKSPMMLMKKKQSILKRNSSMRMSSRTSRRDSATTENTPLPESNFKLQAKKSVLFNCTM